MLYLDDLHDELYYYYDKRRTVDRAQMQRLVITRTLSTLRSWLRTSSQNGTTKFAIWC